MVAPSNKRNFFWQCFNGLILGYYKSVNLESKAQLQWCFTNSSNKALNIVHLVILQDKCNIKINVTQ